MSDYLILGTCSKVNDEKDVENIIPGTLKKLLLFWSHSISVMKLLYFISNEKEYFL